MLDEATALVRQAIAHARLNQFEMVSQRTKEFTPIMQTAMDCALAAEPGSPDAQADWARAEKEFRTQIAIAKTVMAAKTQP